MKTIFLLMVLLVPVTLNAQQKSKTTQYGVISGRVFLITAGGELKVARMAKVYLMWNGYGDLNSPVDEGSAGTRFMDEKSKELKQEVVNIKALEHPSDEVYCLEDLMVYKRAIDNITTWSFAAKKSDQVRLLYANEEDGRFRFPHLRPGRYYLFAEGRAGFNQAVWEDPLIQLKPGDSIEIKLSSTEKSCLVAN